MTEGERDFFRELFRVFPDAHWVEVGGDARTREPEREVLPASTNQESLWEET